MKKRPSPLGFWVYNNRTERDNEPWIVEDDRFEATTLTTSLKQALAKRSDRKWYWLNYKHPEAKTELDGTAVWIDGQYKLYVKNRNGTLVRELYDLSKDRGELNDIAAEKPELVRVMYRQLTDWQKSVENSLTGADYNLETNK